MRKLWVALTVVMLAACGSDKGPVEDPIICEFEQLRCSEDGTLVERCADNGESWEVVQTCITGASCLEGACVCPAGAVAGSEACFQPGPEGCADWFAEEDGGCASTPESCGASQIFAAGQCLPVGVGECPDGWIIDPDGQGCLPDEKPCGEGKQWVMGEGCLEPGLSLSCGNLGSPWPEATPGGEVIYVHSDSSNDEEDGTIAAPYKTIQAAVDSAPDNATVMVGSGYYEDGVFIDRPLTLLGKCAQYVTLEGAVTHTPEGYDFATDYVIVAVDAPGVSISGFTLLGAHEASNGSPAGIFIGGSEDAQVENIHFKFPSGAALHLLGSHGTTVEHCHLEGTNVLMLQVGAYAQTSYGVLVEDSDEVEISNNHFDTTQGADIQSRQSCPLVTRNFFDKRGIYGGLSPVGVWIDGCAESQAVISGNRFFKKMPHAILVEEASCLIERNWIEGTVTDFDDINGPALKATDSQIDIVENYLLDNQFAGINLKSCSGDIKGNRIEGGLASDPGLKGGDGVVLVDCDPGPMKITGNSIVGNVRNGLLVSGSITQVRNNVVAATKQSPSLNASIGAGLNLVEGSDSVVEGNIFVDNFMNGIRLIDSFGQVEGNVVASTSSAGEGRCGGGLVAVNATMGQGITGNLFADNRCAGILLKDCNVAAISGNSVENTVSGEGTLGIGIIVTGTSVDITDNWVRNNKDAGALLDDSYSTVEGNIFEANGTAGVGGGLVVQNVDVPPVTVQNNTFTGNGFAGVVLRTAVFELRRNAMLGNVPNDAGIGGAGAWLEAECQGEVKLNTVEGNLLAGVAAYATSDLTVSLNRVGGTSKGALPGKDVPVQMADGIVAMAGSFVSALFNACQNNEMAGLLYANAEGYASGNQLEENGTWGLHLLSSSITVEANYFKDNELGDESSDSDREAPSFEYGEQIPCSDE